MSMTLAQLADLHGYPVPVSLPGDILEGPFHFAFATEMDYDEAAYNVADLSMVAAAATSGSDLRFQQLAGTGANPPVMMLVVGGRFEIYGTEMYNTVVPENLQADANKISLYRSLPGNKRIDRFPLADYVGVGDHTLNGAFQTTTYAIALRKAKDFELPTPWIVDMEQDAFAIEYFANSKLAADQPCRLTLYGMAWKKGGTVITGDGDGSVCYKQAGTGAIVDAVRKRRAFSMLRK